MAAAAAVHAFVDTKEFDIAEGLIDKFIFDKSQCMEENELMFIAASRLYGTEGKKREKKQIDKAMKEYEKYLEEYFEEEGWSEDGFEFDEEDLPFN